jgi:hypothetical protein
MPLAGQKFGPKITAFLAAIRVMPSVRSAARAARIDRSQHYYKMTVDPVYAKAFQAAVTHGLESMSDVATERAMEGWDEPIVYEGNFQYERTLQPDGSVTEDRSKPRCIRKVDNKLLQFCLEARHPDYKPTVKVKGEIDINLLISRINSGRERAAREETERLAAEAAKKA